MTHNFVFNTDCFASQIRETQHKPSLGHWYLIAFILFTFLSPFRSYSQDILICDNGGFEQDFLYYNGFTSNYAMGSSTCTPLVYISPNWVPVTFTQVSLPKTNRIQIVSNGIDPVTGVSQTLFGSKALMINSYCSTQGDCNHTQDVDRIKKRFLVTEENRDFTIWFSAVIENPSGHTNEQPFFSIRCDLATSDEICFDGINFPANQSSRGLIAGCNQYDHLCYADGDYVKYTDWACHRIHIPKDKVGEFATLEITAADCGVENGGHFGYVYIDGICKECDGGSYGSATLNLKPDVILSCYGDSITIKGRYTLPTIGGYNILHGITVPGFTIYAMSINSTDKTFSFRIIKSDFQSPNPDCRDVIAYLDFKNSSGDHLPLVPTNGIEICLDDFVIPEVDIIIGGCNRNDPNNNIYSDDYYYVNFDIDDADNIHWTLERQLDDPPQGESGRYFINSNGYGNGNYNLGPFLIQEGSWVLILNHNHCADTFQIIPPEYCSGCPQLAKTKIGNITCNSGNTWSYDITVPYANPQQGEYFTIGSNPNHYNFNTTQTIQAGSINQSCKNVIVNYINTAYPGQNCTVIFDVCPPKRCDSGNEGCNLEAYFKKLNCLNNGSSYTIELNVKGSGYPCFVSIGSMSNNQQGTFNNPLGPFTDDITLIIYSCPTPFSCSCMSPSCYKVLKIYKPKDCNTREFGGASGRSSFISTNKVHVLPNPVYLDELIIHSELTRTEYEIFHPSGKRIQSDSFEGSEHRVKFNLPSGLYYLRYLNSIGEFSVINFIKI